MKTPALAILMTLLVAAPSGAQETGTIDIEARKRSIPTLERHIGEREERMTELANDILRLDKRVETQLQRLIDKLAGVSDSETSNWRISQTKMEAMKGLARTAEDYKRKRGELVRNIREGRTGIPKEVLEGDVEKFDEHIEKRVEQILKISKSFTQEKDVEKYESANVGRYYSAAWGWGAEITQISEEWRQNRRDRTMDTKQRKEVMSALEKAIRRLEQLIAQQEQNLKEGGWSKSDRALLNTELSNNLQLLQARRGQLADLMEVDVPETSPLEQGAAHDLQMAIRDAAADLRRDYDEIFVKYAELNRQRAQVFRLQENLAARKKWIEEYKAKEK